MLVQLVCLTSTNESLVRLLVHLMGQARSKPMDLR